MSRRKILVKRTDLPNFRSYTALIKNLWNSKWITNNGIYVQKLEQKLVKLLKVPHLSLLCNGTSPLHIAIKVLNMPQGGEIITTPFTFVATTNVIIWEGFKPVFVDIDPQTWNISPPEIEKAITPNTVAIMPVHVYGNPCDVEAISKIAKTHNLRVIYDAAHAFGVSFRGQSVLSYGDLSSLSFHATKVFHTVEGGALITSDKQLDELGRSARNFGIVENEERVVIPGTNAKMNEFQAVMGLCNMPKLQNQQKVRRMLYHTYKELLSIDRTIRFQEVIASEYNYAYMPVCFESRVIRDKVSSSLEEQNIFPRKYFFPLTNSYPFCAQYKQHSLINAQQISEGILCLPLHSELTIDDIKNICRIILHVTSKS